jgi:hypothetical protein
MALFGVDTSGVATQALSAKATPLIGGPPGDISTAPRHAPINTRRPRARFFASLEFPCSVWRGR